MLKLMYITKDPEVALIAEKAGVDRIFIDLEYVGKGLRQGGMDTVQNRHTPRDVRKIKKVLTKSKLMVRVNPIHDLSIENKYKGTELEVASVIRAGADIVMLPYFKTADEVRRFIKAVKGKAKTLLLFETPESIENIDEILEVEGIDEVFIGLNDLSLGYGFKFMFKPLADGTVDKIIEKFKAKKLPYGFGGVASLGRGALPGEKVIAEHYRLGSTCVILSRSFCNTSIIDNIDVINMTFKNGIKEIREFERYCKKQDEHFFKDNRKSVKKIVDEICQG